MTIPSPTLTGELVVLREAVPDDVHDRQAYGVHPEVRAGYGLDGPDRWQTMNRQAALRWYAMMTAHCPTSWVITADGTLVGDARLHSVSAGDRNARYAVSLFLPTLFGRGYGTDATRVVLAHAFGTMALHRVDLRVLADNDRAVRTYKRCGFEEEGRHRDACWLGGRWHDDLTMAVVR